MSNYKTFSEFFHKATKVHGEPFPYQQELATCENVPRLLSVATGLGKTAAVVLAWLWRRRFAHSEATNAETPRRLVYVFPTRVLVRQTVREINKWLKNLGLEDQVRVHTLIGGEPASEWDSTPDADTVIVGTQDMLISRALNRGYAMSRYRWPIHFGLLNNDCLWVLDETQLMGVGLTTSAQLQGLRERLGTYGTCQSIWMSATLDDRPIRTVDHQPAESEFPTLTTTEQDEQHPVVAQRLQARKVLECSAVALTKEDEKAYAKTLAANIVERHRPDSLTLVVLNQVERAQAVYLAAKKLLDGVKDAPALALVHSRFRLEDRATHEACLFNDGDRIVISTQAIEAGVDVSASTLWTELAPWPPLVQRFGRLNRYGEVQTEPLAQAYWIDLQTTDDKGKAIDKFVSPYEADELARSRELLLRLNEVGPAVLKGVEYEPSVRPVHTLRAKDLLELWDTTIDLSGADLDVSRFIRDSTDDDIQVYWRDWALASSGDAPPSDAGYSEWRPTREELCRVSVGRMRDFLKKLKDRDAKYAWRWDPLEPAESRWQPVGPNEVRPGMALLIHVAGGGYDADLGWTGNAKPKQSVIEVTHDTAEELGDSEVLSDDAESQVGAFVALAVHMDDVVKHVAKLKEKLESLADDLPWQSLHTAAVWHDIGKTHEAFQNMLLSLDGQPTGDGPWAKAPQSSSRPRYFVTDPQSGDGEEPKQQPRRGFRHELASALAYLAHRSADKDANLVAYLIAAHHGKVRASIRSLPYDSKPPTRDGNRLFARGIWQGDKLPPVELPDGTPVPETTLDLSLMQLGSTASGESWLSRTIRLRDDAQIGPFRLSMLETLLRIADWRASKEEMQKK